MFTGIIEAQGKIATIRKNRVDAQFTINTGNLDLSDVIIGDSIAVNGVCLTVISLDSNEFNADVSAETLNKTRMGKAIVNQAVNLEKSLTPTSRLGGHFVSGHIDGIGEIISKKPMGESVIFGIKTPKTLAKYIAQKGSIAVDGVSLTVNAINGCDFYLNIVPHTLNETIINTYQIGDKANLEIDLLARYLERLSLGDKASEPSGITDVFLQKHGFM